MSAGGSVSAFAGESASLASGRVSVTASESLSEVRLGAGQTTASRRTLAFSVASGLRAIGTCRLSDVVQTRRCVGDRRAFVVSAVRVRRGHRVAAGGDAEVSAWDEDIACHRAASCGSGR